MATTDITLEDIKAAQDEITATAEQEGWRRDVLDDAVDYVHNVAHGVDPHANTSEFGGDFEFIKQVIKKHFGMDIPA